MEKVAEDKTSLGVFIGKIKEIVRVLFLFGVAILILILFSSLHFTSLLFLFLWAFVVVLFTLSVLMYICISFSFPLFFFVCIFCFHLLLVNAGVVFAVVSSPVSFIRALFQRYLKSTQSILYIGLYHFLINDKTKRVRNYRTKANVKRVCLSEGVRARARIRSGIIFPSWTLPTNSFSHYSFVVVAWLLLLLLHRIYLASFVQTANIYIQQTNDRDTQLRGSCKEIERGERLREKLR